MLPLLLIAQLAAAKVQDTTTYSSPVIRVFVVDAARQNARVPPTLGEYRATFESEISVGERAGSGRENAVSIEQVASDLWWSRTGDFEQHITGYRAQTLGPQFATIGFFRTAWAVPSLYGNRLALLFGRDTTRRRTVATRVLERTPGLVDTGRVVAGIGRAGRDGGNTAGGNAPPAGTPPNGARGAPGSGAPNGGRTIYVVHPLAADRERFYRYGGGDTVENLTVGGRQIRIVRIEVTPKGILPPHSGVFSGEMDLDADRKQIVRLRGSFRTNDPPPMGPLGILKLTQMEGLIFVELVNSEVNQEYWLPAYQRFEVQAMATTMGDAKAVFRIVSRFHDYQVTAPERPLAAPGGGATPGSSTLAPGTTASSSAALAADALGVRPHALTMAPKDSLAGFTRWREEMGAATAATSTEDFLDVAPEKWQSTGRPVVLVQTERLSDIVRFNRIEGPFTGLGVAVRMRDAAPGVTLRAIGGYAWSERAVRGRVSAERALGEWTYAVRAGRSLDNTNDFRHPFDSGSTIGALFGQDDYDYVDRYSAGVAATRTMGKRQALLRLEAGWAGDRAAVPHLAHGPFGGPSFLANRGVDEGNYVRSAATFEWHPDVAAELMRPGYGAAVSYLRGDGQLNFQRAELRLGARQNLGRWSFSSRFDAGVVAGTPPPQQLFELGREQNLPGYDYKEFAGDQAVVMRGLAMYRLNLLSTPIRITRRYWLPAPSPALALSLQGGWTGASDEAARAAIARLGPRYVTDPNSLALYAPASTTTGNARASVAAGIRFFGGAVGVSLARPIDHVAAWRLQFDFGQ